jgi:hypothetical protein
LHPTTTRTLASIALLALTALPPAALVRGARPSPAQSGPAQHTELIRNGDFELAGLAGWSTYGAPPVRLRREPRPVTRTMVAVLGGEVDARQGLYQLVNVPNLAGADGQLRFWVNLFGDEPLVAADQFCAALASADRAALLVDLGCLDGIEALSSTMDAGRWLEVDYRLSGDEWNAVRGQLVSLTFEMRTNAQRDTVVLLDDVSFQVATGGYTGDRFEPNDGRENATAIPLGQRQAELTIGADGDVDVFRLEVAAQSVVTIDVDAAVDGSPLDAVAELVDADGGSICYGDDEPESVDPLVSCTVPQSGIVYAVIRTHDGHGRSDDTYAVTLQVGHQDTAAPGPGTPAPTATREGTPAPTASPVAPPPAPTATAERSARRAWTAMLYLDGDNGLCGSYPPLIARMERELGGRIGTGGFLNVVVLVDRDPHACGQPAGATRALIQPGGRYVEGQNRWDVGEVNMGDPQTLVDFVRWAMAAYSAEHYYLAIDNHGGGVAGIAWDQTSGNDQLTNAELYGALKAVTANGQRPLDLLAYEACLMGTFENAYDVRRFTAYLLAFQTPSWTSTASYPAYLNDPRFTPATGARELGEVMVDVYHRAVAASPYGVALIDTPKMDGVLSAVARWANALDEQVASRRTALAAAREAAQRLDGNTDNFLTAEDEYLDLFDLAGQTASRGLAAAEAADVQQAVAAAVVRFERRPRPNEPTAPNLDYGRTHGLGIYWPQRPSGWYGQYVRHELYTATRDGTWGDFLESYFSDPAARWRRGLPVDPGPVIRRPADVRPQLFLPLSMIKHAARW